MSKTISLNDCLTLKEFAARLDVTPVAVWKQIKKKRIKIFHKGKLALIHKSEVEKYRREISSRRGKGRPKAA